MLKAAQEILRLRSAALLRQGRVPAAFEDAGLRFKLTGATLSEPFLIGHLVRIAMFDIRLQVVWEGWVHHAWDADPLKTLEQRLGSIDWLAERRRSLEAERAFGNSMLSSVQKDHGVLARVSGREDQAVAARRQNDFTPVHCGQARRTGPGYAQPSSREAPSTGDYDLALALHPGFRRGSPGIGPRPWDSSARGRDITLSPGR